MKMQKMYILFKSKKYFINQLTLDSVLVVNCLIEQLKRLIFQNRNQPSYLSKSCKQFIILTKTIFAIGRFLFLVSFLHSDLKPENFLFESRKDTALIKIIDFGLSTSYLEQVKESDGRSKKVLTKLKTCAGTSLYMAPEVIKK